MGRSVLGKELVLATAISSFANLAPIGRQGAPNPQVCSPPKSSAIYPTDPRIRAKGGREEHASVGPRVDCHFDRRSLLDGWGARLSEVAGSGSSATRRSALSARSSATGFCIDSEFILVSVSSGLRSTPQSERFCYCSLCVSWEQADGEVDSRAVRSNCISLLGLDDRFTSIRESPRTSQTRR